MYRRYDYRREWNPVSLGGCVLHLPFYKYGKEASKIWDQSGYHNDGIITGATPTQYPKLSGVELVTNGGMEVGTPPTGWSAVNTPEVFERSAVQKHSGSYSAHVVDSTASYGGFNGHSLVSGGKRYKMSFWYYIVSGAAFFAYYNGGWTTNNITTTGSWQYAEYIDILADTDSYFYFRNNSNTVPAEFYIDDVSVQEVIGYESIGWGFDGVDDKVTVTSTNYGKIHTLLVWLNHYHNKMTLLGGADTYRISKDTTNLYYNAGATEVSVAHGQSTSGWNCYAVTRSAAAVNFYKNGVQIGTEQTLDANNDLTVSMIGYGTGGAYLKGNIGEKVIFNRALPAQEIKAYYEKTRHIYGI